MGTEHAAGFMWNQVERSRGRWCSQRSRTQKGIARPGERPNSACNCHPHLLCHPRAPVTGRPLTLKSIGKNSRKLPSSSLCNIGVAPSSGTHRIGVYGLSSQLPSRFRIGSFRDSRDAVEMISDRPVLPHGHSFVILGNPECQPSFFGLLKFHSV